VSKMSGWRRQAGPGPQAARVTGGRRSRRRCVGGAVAGGSVAGVFGRSRSHERGLYSRFFLKRGVFRCRFGSPTPRGCCQGWVESNEGGLQSLARRSRYSIWPLKFEFECLPTQNAFRGSGTARNLGPTPRGRLKFGRMLAFRTRAARNRRVKDARRSVTGPLSAASARYLRIGDSDFGAVNTGKRDFSKWR